MHNRLPKPSVPAQRMRGFTLIELMVTVAIVGILASIAYPAYGNYLIKGNRAAAQAHLMELAQAEAQYMADTRSYADTVDHLRMTTPTSVASKYTITIDPTDGPPPTFKISAVPISSTNQAADGTLTIDNAGAKTPSDKW
jgi:type IV pilus assembly protein PilE